MPGYEMTYLALAAHDVDAVCQFLGDSLWHATAGHAARRSQTPFFGIGQSAVALFEPDDPYLEEPRYPGVHLQALAAEDPAGSATKHGLTVTEEGVGPDGKSFVTIDPKETVGIRTRFIEPMEIPTTDGPAYKIDHLGIATDDNDGTVRVFTDNLGCPIDSTQTDVEVRHVTESFHLDKYGAIYHSRQPEIPGGLRDAFINIGDCELELLMDFDLEPDAEGVTSGEEKGQHKGRPERHRQVRDRRGPGLAHVAFATRDIDAILPKLADDGWRMIDLEGRPGGRGSLTASSTPRTSAADY